MVEVRGELRLDLCGDLVLDDVNDESGSTQGGDPAAGDTRIGIEDPDDDAFHTGGDDRVDARRRAAVMRARLQRHVQRRPPGPSPGLTEGDHLGVSTAGRFGRTRADDDPVGHEDRPHPGIRRRGDAHGRSAFDGERHGGTVVESGHPVRRVRERREVRPTGIRDDDQRRSIPSTDSRSEIA
jgi:hypothetical protein